MSQIMDASASVLDYLLVESPLEAWNPLFDPDIAIAVMGPTGAGKSTFINNIVGAAETAVGDSLGSCTREIQSVECFDSQGQRVILVDTPGFNDTHLSDLEVLESISNWLKKTYQGGQMLSGLLFLHRISDNRMGSSPLRLLETFKNICGDDALQNVVLVTTMWDEVSPEEGATREQELRRTYWKHMISHGSRMKRSSNTKESAWDIISDFRPGARRPLLLQKEMVNERKPLSETTAGRPLFRWLVDVVKAVQKAVKALKKRLSKAKRVEQQTLKDDICRQDTFLKGANERIRSYTSNSDTETITDIPRASSFTREPSKPPFPIFLPRPKLFLEPSACPEPASNVNTPSDVPTEDIILCDLRAKSVNAFKIIHQLLGPFPVSGLSRLIKMVVKMGEMIEKTEPLDIGLLSQFQDICNMTSSIIEAAQHGINGSVEAIIDSFVMDMKRILGSTSNKGLVRELLSEQSNNAIDKCCHRLLADNDRFGLKVSIRRTNPKSTIERLELLINHLRTQKRI